MGRWHHGKGGLAHSEGIRQVHWRAEVGAARSATLCRLENYAESPLEPIVVRGFPLRRLGIVLTRLQTLQELQDGVFRTVTSRFRSIPSLHLSQNFFFERQIRIQVNVGSCR